MPMTMQLSPTEINALITFQAHQIMQLQLRLANAQEQREDLARQLADARRSNVDPKPCAG